MPVFQQACVVAAMTGLMVFLIAGLMLLVL